jgi:hypothetical protein
MDTKKFIKQKLEEHFIYIVKGDNMAFSYTTDPNTFAVKIYTDNQTEPVIFQPDWPNGTEWSSKQEAETWAQLCIASIEDPAAPYAPAGPGIAGEPKVP